VEVDMSVEQLLAIELDAMRHAHIADGAARKRGMDRLHHGLWRADALEHGVSTDSLCHLHDTRYPFVAALGHDAVAPNAHASFCRVACPLMAMILSAPICFAERTPSRPTAPSPTTATVMPVFTLAAIRGKPAGAQHV